MKRRVTYFVASDSQPRVRRTADVVTAITGLVLVFVGMWGVDRVTPFEQALEDLLTSQPSWLTPAAHLVYTFGIHLSGGSGRCHDHRRQAAPIGAARRALGGGCGACILALALGFWLTGEWPYILPEIGLEDPEPRFPVLRLVIVASSLVAAAPNLARPVRWLGWIVILLSGFAAVTLGYGDPSDALGAVGLGLLAGGSVLVVFGSPRGYPDPAAVEETLEGMGLAIDDRARCATTDLGNASVDRHPARWHRALP